MHKVPHVLTCSQKKKRVDLAGDLLDLLRDKKKWPRILTGDETWIYMNNHGAAEWVLPGEDRSVIPKKQIGDKKLMLIVFFSSSGVHYSHFMEERESVNSETIMAAMSCIGTSLNTSETSKAWIHMDNASSHRAKTTQKALKEAFLIEAPHPPNSPDLAPCDFFLFGFLKGEIAGTIFNSYEELQVTVMDILHKIPAKKLKLVFNNWIKRLDACVRTGGEYVRDDS